MSTYRTESCIINRAGEIEQEWLELQQSADHSYFQSWSWIEVWLAEIAIPLHPLVIKVWHGENLIGLGLFVSKDIKRRFIFRAKAMYLNEYPFDGCDMTIEYNGLLATTGYEDAVYKEAVDHLLRKYPQYDELCFGAMPERLTSFSVEKTLNKKTSSIVYETSVSRSVHLDALDPGMDSYLDSLSRNRRTQIRRAIKEYDSDGTLQIEEAKNIDQALHYFERLKILHTDYWQSKNKAGSFSNPIWQKFHLALISRGFYAGEIQLLKVSSSYGEIGYLYNLVKDKHVYVLQTGFKQSENKRLMPGYVAHVFAITHNKSKGMQVYDLMHGDTLYKQLLCNRKQTLVWVTLQRKRVRFTIENALVSIVRYLRKA